MALQMGIVGLPNVGKSTLLNALTRAHAEASNYPFCTIDKNVGAAVIDDPRQRRLADLLAPKETIPASIRFVDIAGLVRGASKGEGLGNQFLGHIREVDAIVHAVRCFESETIVHVDGTLDPRRDFEVVETELLLADIDTVDRHRSKVEHASKGNPREAGVALDALAGIRARLAQGVPLRRAELSQEERDKVQELCLLTAKPVVVVANVAGDDPLGRSPLVAELAAGLHGEPLLCFAVELEEQIASLDPGDRAAFFADLGLEAGSLDRLLAVSRELLHLVTFYTTANDKLQSWLVPAGTTAPRAAGRIHGDMERGFIRMEVFRIEDLEEHRTKAEMHKHGRIRTEGKDYRIQDGDVCHVLFHA